MTIKVEIDDDWMDILTGDDLDRAKRVARHAVLCILCTTVLKSVRKKLEDDFREFVP